MRWVICALVVLALPPSAVAGDFDVLRGSQSVGPATFTNWTGFYAGGQYGYSDANSDFSASTQGPLAYSLRELAVEEEQMPSAWPVLGTADSRESTYGGFVGYNTQWQDLILGIEANLNHSSFSLTAPNSPISRITPTDGGGNNYLINITANGTVTNFDFGTLRARAGWALGNFLPYGFVGLALGKADVHVTATVSGQQDPPTPAGPCNAVTSPTCVPFSFTNSSGKDSELMYGFAVGGGLDLALTSNIFLRGEYEYVQFAPVAGVLVAVSTARVGAGIKF